MSKPDLRSDTLTVPSPAMREAMAGARVGDDVFREDPTVLELEAEVAALLGKEAAVFTPSGTMANQIGISLWAGAGDEVWLDAGAHIFNYEAGAAAALWGITLRPVPATRGVPQAAGLAQAVRPPDDHLAPVRAVAVENTHNREGGAVCPVKTWDEVVAAAKAAGLAVHLDGARLWNATVALGVPPERLARGADSVSVCFSKGLGAPAGSVLAGAHRDILRARARRKRLGGGMRQAGILAAGARYALAHNLARLSEDHRRAARLGDKLAAKRGVQVLPVETNIVIADVAGSGLTESDAVSRLADHGLRVLGFGGTRIRMVTHLDVDDDQLAAAEAAIDAVFEEEA